MLKATPQDPEDASCLNAAADDDNNNFKQPRSLRSRIKRFLSFCGPGYMIAVGYMDPGNWATDIEAGSKYGYSLLYIILLSNVMAIVLQHLCIRVGVYTRRDLAQNCRIHCHPMINWFLYIVAELAIISCDLSEVIGTAIALNLLFGLPIMWGVVFTVADVLLLLAGFNSDNSAQYRVLEFIVMIMMSVVGVCFCAQVVMVKPDWRAVALGFIPRSTALFTDRDALFAALGIIGATVMPHNLYLHSSIVKYRLPPPLPAFKPDDTDNEEEEEEEEGEDSGCVRERENICDNILDNNHNNNHDNNHNNILDNNRDKNRNNHHDNILENEIDIIKVKNYWSSLNDIIKFNTIDTLIALFLALLINAAILIVSAAAFNSRGRTDVKHIEDASALMREWLGSAASVLFALALLAAGQSSTVTGTLAGQIVFEGFLKMKMAPWLRRILTRVVAILPAILIIYWTGEESVSKLLIYSQVILSFQLPFAIIPLIIFAFPKNTRKLNEMPLPPQQQEKMAKILCYSKSCPKFRPFIPLEANRGNFIQILKFSSWTIAAIIIALNIIFPIISLQEE